jgi:Protein of unknown function (DUF2510)/Short C-terminal domain
LDENDAVPTPADWYEDPEDATQYRYWDGSAWTEHRSPKGAVESEAATEADTVDEGHGEFGDGITTPLYEFRASRWKGGRPITPNVIRVWPDRIEEYRHHAIRKKGTDSIHWARVAQVTIHKGLRWSDLRVESNGGHVISIDGMRKQEAERVKVLLDEAVIKALTPAAAPQPAAVPVERAAVPDLADQLRKLAGLRDDGILSDAEFETQKARLLDQ